jgi:hypothetical protein
MWQYQIEGIHDGRFACGASCQAMIAARNARGGTRRLVDLSEAEILKISVT